MTKYYRKTPVEAIQWTGENPSDVRQFLNRLGYTGHADYDNMFAYGIDDDDWWEYARRVRPGQWLVSDEDMVLAYPNDAFHSAFGEYKDD